LAVGRPISQTNFGGINKG